MSFRFLFLIVFFSVFKLKAQQNLVLNHSFENISATDFSDCNSVLFRLYAEPWENISGTIDLYHLQLPNYCNFSASNLGNILPIDGQAYAGGWFTAETFQNLNTIYSGEYMLGELQIPLEINRTHKITFYVARSTASRSSFNQFGFKFFNSIAEANIYFTNSALLDRIPDVMYEGLPIQNSQQWTRIDLEYTPTTTGKQFFVFGIYNPNESMQILNDNENNTYMNAYYFYDNFSISPIIPSFNEISPICQGAELSLPSISLDGYEGTWSPAINNQQTTTYTFTPNSPYIYTTTLTVDVLPKQVATFDFIPKICVNDSDFVLPNISSNGIVGTWDKPFNNKQTETYIFTPNSNVVCAHTTAVRIEIIPEISFKTLLYCENNQMNAEIVFTNNTIDDYSIEWILNDTPLNENDKKISFAKYGSLLRNINILKVKVSFAGVCSVEKEFNEFNVLNCEIPKGISPNGDGINESFNLSYYPVASLEIFNRYGQVVYSKTNYTNEWKGQSNNGNQLSTGTYFYTILMFNGKTETGWIELLNE